MNVSLFGERAACANTLVRGQMSSYRREKINLFSAGSLRGACFNSSESGTGSAGGRVASSSHSSSHPVAFWLSHEVRPQGFVSGHWARRPLFTAQKRGFGVRHGAVLAAARFCDSRKPRQASALVRLPHSQHPSH